MGAKIAVIFVMGINSNVKKFRSINLTRLFDYGV